MLEFLSETLSENGFQSSETGQHADRHGGASSSCVAIQCRCQFDRKVLRQSSILDTAHLADLRQQIFEEIKARTQETDLSVPTRQRGYWYYSRSFEGKEYGASCRVRADGDDWTPPSPAQSADSK